MYFKHEAIAWSWEFLTKVVGLDPERLYPSVYVEDDEAFEIWNKEVGIPAEPDFPFWKRGQLLGAWSGPCGPCSEIYYDRGEKYGCGKPDCTVGCECDRYRSKCGIMYLPSLKMMGKVIMRHCQQKNIDTGMGLERLAVIVQDVDSIFNWIPSAL